MGAWLGYEPKIKKGQRIGSLKVLSVRKESMASGYPQFVAYLECACGVKYKKPISELTRRNRKPPKHCAKCRMKEFTPHGHARYKKETPTYIAWKSMKHRCNGKSRDALKNYKNIKIEDPRWLTFENFLADMGERPSPKLSLDRIDNLKGYCKSNCRWATAMQQIYNRRVSVKLTAFGVTMGQAQWEQRLGLVHGELRRKLNSEFSLEHYLAAKKLVSLSGVIKFKNKPRH